jgi:hypothetical protein
MSVHNYVEYRDISRFYAGKTAKRSGLPYMNHIDEGLLVLDEIDAGIQAKRAFCLHPLVQADVDLPNYEPSAGTSGEVIVRAMEYRNVANRCLSFHNHLPKLSPLKDVNDMLIADKVQNYKDFLDHHQWSHPQAQRLKIYFERWLDVLGITRDEFERLAYILRKYRVEEDAEDASESVRAEQVPAVSSRDRFSDYLVSCHKCGVPYPLSGLSHVCDSGS